MTGRIAVPDPAAFAIGDGAIWIAHFSTGTVTRVDPATGRTTNAISLLLPRSAESYWHDRHFLPSGISVEQRTVWVSTARGWLAEIGGSSRRLVAVLRQQQAAGQVISADRKTWVVEALGLGSCAPALVDSR